MGRVTEGYYNDPERTAATLDSERWLRRGMPDDRGDGEPVEDFWD